MIFSLTPSICSSRRKDATTLVSIAVSCSSYPICLEAIAALHCTLYSLSHLISILYQVLTSKPCWHYVSSVALRTRTVSVTGSPDGWSLAVVQWSSLCCACLDMHLVSLHLNLYLSFKLRSCWRTGWLPSYMDCTFVIFRFCLIVLSNLIKAVFRLSLQPCMNNTAYKFTLLTPVWSYSLNCYFLTSVSGYIYKCS